MPKCLKNFGQDGDWLLWSSRIAHRLTTFWIVLRKRLKLGKSYRSEVACPHRRLLCTVLLLQVNRWLVVLYQTQLRQEDETMEVNVEMQCRAVYWVHTSLLRAVWQFFAVWAGEQHWKQCLYSFKRPVLCDRGFALNVLHVARGCIFLWMGQ